jgi:hypothetical protein
MPGDASTAAAHGHVGMYGRTEGRPEHMSETQQESQEGVADAVRGLSDNTSALVRHEIAAAQREMLGKVKEALPALGLLGAGAFFGVLSAAATYRLSVRLLEKVLPPATAASVAAAGYGVAAGAAGAIGIRQLRANQPLFPVETVRQTVKTAADTAKSVSDTTSKTAAGTAKKVTGTTSKTPAETPKAPADTAKTPAESPAKKAPDKGKAGAAAASRATSAAKSRAGRRSSTAKEPGKAS